MSDIEQKNIEKSHEWEKNKQPEKVEKHELTEKSELWKLKAEIVTHKEKEEADKLVIEWVSWAKKEKTQETIKSQPSIHEAVKKLNRPEAEKGIEQSYASMEKTIKNSPEDKNIIASLAWRIINSILW
ncbi:MAG: hypothetical protein ACD_80C00178G0003 [uncultured bacterium (gcode 4)]|uniref:Uncharacterized protein n=1 Tax=uncultured bacterium (gcode 4) TaxID=1234023 RepID=K1XHW6_9BACT|nr:MAG: hypothetical protein ACD_80C00178G0003 [uncultured bacterium (gcode 4)]